MRYKLLLLLFLWFVQPSFAQQLGNGYAPPIDDFCAILGSGMYTGGAPNGSVPEGGWQHLLVVRHGNSNNNYQLQIGSSIFENDKLYFRKIANGGLNLVNPNWIELATRKSNSFNGDQIFLGNVEIKHGFLNIQRTLNNAEGKATIDITGSTGSGDGAGLVLNQIWNGRYYKTIIDNHGNAYGQTGSGLRVQTSYWNGSEVYSRTSLTLTPNGNVGIGTSSPQNLLDVNGTIHAREIKVDLNGWSDFVFHPSYQLKPLTEVEQFIKTNCHLQDIPSAIEVEQNGVNVGEMQKKLLQKVEELTLYVIEQNKTIETLQERVQVQDTRIKELETVKH